MKKALSLLTILACSASIAHAAEAQAYKCLVFPLFSLNKGGIVIATINSDGETGSITVAGQTQKAVYGLDGLDRRWDFGLKGDDDYDYSFVINPGGLGLYFDWRNIESGESVEATMTFICKQE